jgi:hypothetical protein
MHGRGIYLCSHEETEAALSSVSSWLHMTDQVVISAETIRSYLPELR